MVNTVPDIDSLLTPTAEEYSRQRAVGAIHTHAMLRLRFDCRTAFEQNVLPGYVAEHGRAPQTGAEIAEAMKTDHFYRFYSSIRYNAQEMGPLARQAAVERALPQMIEVARSAAQSNAAGGSLRLNPDLEIPHYVSEGDVHLAPGGYHSEFGADDVAQGVLLGRGLSPTAGAGRITKTRNFAGVGQSIAYWLKATRPDFRPARVLDMATQSGANLTAYSKAFPGIEAHGIDVAAPGLRYGHAKAEFEDVAIHFSQQDAAATDFPDGHFDLIVSSFFLHEVPVPVTRQILKEVHRLLAPGGILAFMELPPHKACDAFMNFAYDWDTENNAEPYYASYRSQDPTELAVEAGFPRADTFEVTIPDVTSFDLDQYPAFVAGAVESPPHGRGGWYLFGGRKAG
ncbi:MAG: class I SAM-dependent methyltransferase [Azospirillaceae bacterium]|nr:class I SAM-dependent methyltransferase [Azospirillaceae bacterium]